MPQSNSLHRAKAQKNDEFYTQYADIEKEINAYLEYNPDVFRDKTILLPCDDPEWSNFTKYFAQNFERFGIKKLISTSYAANSKSPDIPYQLTLFEKDSPKFDEKKTRSHGKIFVLERDTNKDKKIDINDLEWDYLDGDGDFRSKEIKKLRDESDIIVTNPPFSLFRAFINWLTEANKSFIIIGNLNAINDKDVFSLLIKNKAWLGSSYFNGGAAYFAAPMELYDPSKMSNDKHSYIKDGRFYWRVNGVRWYTNIEHGRRHKKMALMSMADNIKFNKKLKKKFDKEFDGVYYPKYDNYDAIEIPFCDGIPSDYKGIMGVSISFMDKYCPEQFEIIGRTGDIEWATSSACSFFTPPPEDKIKYYKSLNKTWRVQNPYILDSDGKPRTLYNRIFIKEKESQ